MDIEHALIADYAEIVGGKLYVMGAGWDQTFAPQVPATVRLAAAIGVRVGWEETNQSIPVQVIVEDDDAHELVRVDGAVQVGRAPDLRPGSSQLAQVAINLTLALPQFGGYRLRVTAGSPASAAEATRPFRLVQR